jgi:hypothetical protein
MTPNLRKSILTVHITTSVGWLGAVAAFLALAIVGCTSRDAQVMRAVYPDMERIAWSVIVPFAFAALLSGLIQSLSTPWGLFRHTWVLVKLLLTFFATVVLLKKMPLIDYAARGAGAAQLPIADLHLAGTELIVHAAGGLLVLLAITFLSVFKPWGLTRYGRRKLLERGVPPPPLNQETPVRFGFNLLLTILGILLAVVAVLHLTGHGLHHTH